jgi:ABC-type nitrate/sulfonate/bicarbonate transport system substrate-binding protein
MSAPYEYVHVVSVAKLHAERRKIETALSAGGYDPSCLDLLTAAMSAIRRDFYIAAMRLGINYYCFWEPAEYPAKGEVISFFLADEKQAMLLKTMVL